MYLTGSGMNDSLDCWIRRKDFRRECVRFGIPSSVHHRRILRPTQVVLGQAFPAALTGHVLDAVPRFAKLLVGVLIGEREVHDDIAAARPVDRRRHAVLDRQLQRVNDTDDLIKVATRRGGVCHDQRNRLVGFEDVDAAHREREAFGVLVLGIQHSQLDGVFAGRIAKERILKRVGVAHMFDVLDPSGVRRRVVAREAYQLDVARCEGRLALGGLPELRRADRRKVRGMHKDDAPRVAQVLVQIERIGRLRGADQVGKL